MEVSFEALRRAQLEEKRSPTLAPLPEDFYGRYSALMREHQARLHAQFSLEAASVHESMRRVLRDVWERRQHKLAVKAITDARSGNSSLEGLCAEEQRLYNAILTLLKKGDVEFTQSMGSNTAAPQTAAQPAAEVTITAPIEQGVLTRVKTLADLPAFVGPDGQSFGPFRAGAEVDLPANTANLLQKRGAAQMVAAQSTVGATA